jgi:hypothetical protein
VAGLDATQEADVTALFEHARERLLPFATADWARIWPSFVHDLSDLVSSLAPGVLLQKAMAGIVPALSIAPASPAAPTLPEVLISAAESSSSPSPSPSPSLPSPVALPSPTGTSGPTRASSSGRDRSPQSARGSDVSRASRPIRSLPARTGAPRLASSPGSSTAAAAVAAAAPPALAPIVTDAAAVSPVMAPSVPADPAPATSVSDIDPNVGDWPDHACVCCSQRRQKCAIPEGRDPLDTSEPCLRCVRDKKVCDWTREAVGAFEFLPHPPLLRLIYLVYAVLKRPAGGVKRSARLARKASRAATALPKRPSPSLSMKFPNEVPVRPTQGTERASLQELLTWHVEVAASCYAYRDRLAVHDALLAREKIVAQEVGVADDRRQYAWDRYRRLAGLSASGEPLVPPPRPSSRAKGTGKERAVTVLSGDEEDNDDDDDEGDEEDFGGSAWTGIGGRDDDGGAGAGSSRAMDVS